MAYSNIPIGTPNPGCFVILVDQSWSMNEEWKSGTKAEAAALIVSRIIYELGLACDTQEGIKDRCRVCLIGYGDDVHSVADGMISDLHASPIEVKKVNRLIPDGAGGTVEIEADMPIWLRPQSSNGTPMHTAFDRAAEIVQQWCTEWPGNFPPIVFNITDGEAYDPVSTADVARKVMNFQTTDGNALVFNVHIANSGNEVIFPHDKSQLAQDPFAEFLFDISSELPETLREEARNHGFSPQPNARCFGHNVTEVGLTKILEFGTLGTGALVPMNEDTDIQVLH